MNDDTRQFTLRPAGPFDLAAQNRHFGGWPAHPEDPGALVMSFPIEGAPDAAAVVVSQQPDGLIRGEVHHCPPALIAAARSQALAATSLDVDGSGWPEVGAGDPLIGELQARYGALRPVLFHSPYEAAAAFVVGHRISIAQGRALRAALATRLGTTIAVAGHPFPAFPSPAQVLAAGELPGLSAQKAERLRAVARAAQDGWLERDRLRAAPVESALAALETLPGVGPFFSRGILYRGAGLVDEVTEDDVTQFAVTQRYRLAAPADHARVLEVADRWRPYRMWAVVLLHVWVRREVGLPPRTFSAGRGSGRLSAARRAPGVVRPGGAPARPAG